MSDPAKDASIRRSRESRESVAERYTPIVLWVRPDTQVMKSETSGGLFSIDEFIRREIRDTAKEIPFIDVADSNEPHIESVVTEFDTEQ